MIKLKDLLNEHHLILEYKNSGLNEIISEKSFRGVSRQTQSCLIEAYTLYSNYNDKQLLNEIDLKKVIKKVGQKAAGPFLATAKVYKKITDPVNKFVNKFAYEKTGLEDFDTKIFDETKEKFDSFLNSLDSNVADKLKDIIKTAQKVAKDHPIKLGLLTVAMLSAMSFTGAGMIPVIVTSVLLRGTLGLLKGEKPIKAFGKSMMYSVIGKTIGWLGSEFWDWAKDSLFSDDEVKYIQTITMASKEDSSLKLDSNLQFSDIKDIGKKIEIVKDKIEGFNTGKSDINTNEIVNHVEYLQKELEYWKTLPWDKTESDVKFIKQLEDELSELQPTFDALKTAPTTFFNVTGINPNKPTTFREIIKSLYEKMGKLSSDEIDMMINDKFPKNSSFTNKYFGKLDIDTPIKKINFINIPDFNASYDPITQEIGINIDLLTDKKQLFKLLGHEGIHGSDLEADADNNIMNFRHFDSDASHQSVSRSGFNTVDKVLSFIRDYIGDVSEIQARLREVQEAAIEAFEDDGIMKRGDVESGQKFLKWFLFSKDDPSIAQEFNGIVPDERFNDGIKELKAYMKLMMEKGFNIKHIFDVFAERATELAMSNNIEIPSPEMDFSKTINPTMVAEDYKLLTKELLFND
jgi:hypothetical protein